jgi:hypothetical protein
LFGSCNQVGQVYIIFHLGQPVPWPWHTPGEGAWQLLGTWPNGMTHLLT